MSDRDPLEALRGAWNDVRPPAPDVDPATDPLVEDLRALWSRVEAPVSDSLEFRRALQRHRRAARRRDGAVLAAAASLLVTLILVARDDAPQRPRVEEQVAVGEAHPPPTPVSVQADPRVRTLSPEVRARTLDDGGLELRHGRVRLLLGGHSRTIIESDDPAARPAANAEEDSK